LQTAQPRPKVPQYLDRGFELATWLILAVTPLLINVYNVDAYRTIQATFASIVIALGLGAWAIARSVERNWHDVKRVPLLGVMGAFLVWTLFTVPRSPSPALGLASWWNLATYLLAFVALADVSARDEGVRWRLLIPLFFGFFANAVIGIMQYQHAPFMEYYRNWPQQPWVANYFAGLDAPAKLGSAAGMLGNQNVLGNYLIGGIPLAFLLGVAWIRDRKQWPYAVTLVIIGVLGIAALIATQTRGAWIGQVIGFGYAAVAAIAVYRGAIRRVSPKTWLAIGLGVLVIAGGLAFKGNAIGLGRAIDKIHRAGSDSTSMQRINAWHVAKTMADTSPVMGEGLATYKILYFRYLEKTFAGKPIPPIMHHRYVQAHNDFIQLAGETGYVGFLLSLVVLFGFAGGATWWLIRRPDLTTAERMVVIGGVSGVLGIAGSAIFGFPYHIASSSVLSVGAAGLVGGLWTRARRAEAPEQLVLHSEAQIAIYTYALPLAIAVLTIAVVWSNWTPYEADKLTKQGQELYRLQRIQEAQASLDRAIQLDPERGDARLMMGLIYAIYNRFPESEKQFVEAQRSYDDVTLHYYLGRVYESMGKPDKARHEYDDALHYFPSGEEITKAVKDRVYLLDHPAEAAKQAAKERAAMLAAQQAQQKAQQAQLQAQQAAQAAAMAQAQAQQAAQQAAQAATR
jgi:tetratricopeptide (TPR) repeat protein